MESFNWKKCPSYATIHTQQHSIHSRLSLNVLEIYILFNVCFNYEIIIPVFVTTQLLSLSNKSLHSKISPRDYKEFLIKYFY